MTFLMVVVVDTFGLVSIMGWRRNSGNLRQGRALQSIHILGATRQRHAVKVTIERNNNRCQCFSKPSPFFRVYTGRFCQKSTITQAGSWFLRLLFHSKKKSVIFLFYFPLKPSIVAVSYANEYTRVTFLNIDYFVTIKNGIFKFYRKTSPSIFFSKLISSLQGVHLPGRGSRPGYLISV